MLSMCAELAAFELKELFLKIHYFGRKIKFTRKQKKIENISDVRASSFATLQVEVKELLKIIEEIRARYPEKERITPEDILEVAFFARTLQYIAPTNAASVAVRARLAYLHEWSARERRDTIAFQPHSIEALKFADDQDQEDRSQSRMEEAPLIDQ